MRTNYHKCPKNSNNRDGSNRDRQNNSYSQRHKSKSKMKHMEMLENMDKQDEENRKKGQVRSRLSREGRNSNFFSNVVQNDEGVEIMLPVQQDNSYIGKVDSSC